jgi:putative NADH-flavin reductase
MEGEIMKIVVIGNAGLIGDDVVLNLVQKGHDVVAISRNIGANTITGEGLQHSHAGAQAVANLPTSPAVKGGEAVVAFVRTSGRAIAGSLK